MNALKQVQIQLVFCAWVEEWEEVARKKNDCVTEAQLLAKYKGLVFRDPDTNLSFKVWEQNLEFRQGRGGGGWYVIGQCADDPDNEVLEPFLLEMACELIGEMQVINSHLAHPNIKGRISKLLLFEAYDFSYAFTNDMTFKLPLPISNGF
jgi:hypothetical protein